jgi:hypothetical protein
MYRTVQYGYKNNELVNHNADSSTYVITYRNVEKYDQIVRFLCMEMEYNLGRRLQMARE